MRVLFVGHTYIVSANRQKLRELANFGDVELSLVVPRQWPHSFKKYLVDRDDSPQYAFYPTRTIFQGHEGAYLYSPELTMHIARIKPDIIHVEQGVQALSYTQVILNKKLFAPQAKCVFFAWAIHPPRRLYWAAIEKFSLKNSDYAIAGTRDVVQVLKQKQFDKPVRVLPQLGIDPNLWRPFEAAGLGQELSLEGFVVGYVGRLMKEKGLDTLIEAFSRLDGPRTLVFVGRGGYQDEMLALANSLGVADLVRFVDAVPHAEVSSYMNCLDVMVLPSRTVPPYFKEQFGHVLIEAMACETPVIGSDSGEIPNVIGDAGLIFCEGDVQGLAEKLQLLMDDLPLRTKLAAKGRQRVLAKYTDRHIAEEIYQIYQEMLEQ
jgi:glycosyltransferase involved in cell wall biosynthesis